MKPTKAQLEKWAALAEKGCAVCSNSQVQIHHCLTGAGGRKNHDKVLHLCYTHHQGACGIHTLGRKKWQQLYGSEEVLMKGF